MKGTSLEMEELIVHDPYTEVDAEVELNVHGVEIEEPFQPSSSSSSQAVKRRRKRPRSASPVDIEEVCSYMFVFDCLYATASTTSHFNVCYLAS